MLAFRRMSSMPPSVQSIWACSILAQLIALTLLLLRRNANKIPFFTAYIVLNLCQAGFMLVLVLISTLSPGTFAKLSWLSEAITLLAQAVATAEILGLTLRPYPGIWGLAWRALVVVSSLVVLILVWVSHARETEQLWFQLNRGYHLTFATAVIACLALTIWIVALWKPFPVDDRQIASPSDSTYLRLSPEINERLREINEKLLPLWKMEARPE